MQHLTKEKVLLAFVVASLIFCVFMFLATTKTVVNVSAVEANGVGVYWDSNCSDIVEEIPWGTLNPGSVKNVPVYIQNREAEPMYLILSTTNWNPLNASDFLELTWNYTAWRMNPGEVLQITLTLSVSRYIQGISSFSFDILVAGSDSLPGDVNGDGEVTATDLAIVKSYATKTTLELITMEEALAQQPFADVNGDDQITATDVAISRSEVTKAIM